MFSTETHKEPLTQLPEDLEGKKICLKCGGGLGDMLMSVGMGANYLDAERSWVTAAVSKNHAEVAMMLAGVHDVIPITSLNDVETRSKFDCVIDFYGTFATAKQIRHESYYTLVAKRLGIPVLADIGEFTFDRNISDKNLIAIHPGASNPNRRWANKNWEHVGRVLLGKGYRIVWLGTPDEFGFECDGSTKASLITTNLLAQIMILSKCFYFLGNDSGFCHVAGLLDIPSTVIFSATDPNNVVRRYGCINSVDVFSTENRPSFSCEMDDAAALNNLASITPDMLLANLGASWDSTKYYDGPIKLCKPKLNVVVSRSWSDIDLFLDDLKKTYDVQEYTEKDNPSNLCPYLWVDDEFCEYWDATHKRHLIPTQPEVVCNALRNLGHA